MLGAPIACALLACSPSAARAYSDPLSYADEAVIGGGGGRWFTGSSADGFGCEVCHEGGAVADLTITGLPLDGFVPGASYEITVGWPASAEHGALIAELTDEARMGVGTLQLPRPDATPETERCSGELLGAPSSALHMASIGRQLISVVDCGARQVRFQWSVPAVAPSTVWMHVGFITSDEDTSPRGDGVTMVNRVLVQQGTSQEAQVVAQGCDATRGTERGSWLAPLCLLAVFAWQRRSRSSEVERCNS